MYMASLTPPGTFGCAKKLPRCHQSCSKRSFLGLNVCLRSKFDRFLKKSQICFRLQADFRKKVCKKRVKIGVLTFLPHFTLFHPIFLILPYFGPHLGCGIQLGVRTKPRGDGTATNLDSRVLGPGHIQVH